jgi:hypothetical protein
MKALKSTQYHDHDQVGMNFFLKIQYQDEAKAMLSM